MTLQVGPAILLTKTITCDTLQPRPEGLITDQITQHMEDHGCFTVTNGLVASGCAIAECGEWQGVSISHQCSVVTQDLPAIFESFPGIIAFFQIVVGDICGQTFCPVA